MRSWVYGVAVIAAVGIAIGIANVPNRQLDSATSVNTAALSEPGTMVLSVPDMMCEFSCFPKIKETLEATESVSEVELAQQKEEGTVDNRQVIVKYNAGFDVNEAIGLLKAEGFDNSEVVQ